MLWKLTFRVSLRSVCSCEKPKGPDPNRFSLNECHFARSAATTVSLSQPRAPLTPFKLSQPSLAYSRVDCSREGHRRASGYITMGGMSNRPHFLNFPRLGIQDQPQASAESNRD